MEPPVGAHPGGLLQAGMIDYDALIRQDDPQVRQYAVRPFNDERINLRCIADTKVLFHRALRYEVAADRYLTHLGKTSNACANSRSGSRCVGR